MDLAPAPFLDDLAGVPAGGAAHWLQTPDSIRIRLGHWQPEGKPRGTVLMFPGRTEFIEKYGHAAGEFTGRGYVFAAIDWRGQGLADRLLPDTRVGHVVEFTDYQKDVEAVVRAAEALDLPRPWYVIGHSMGGAIGLRAVMEGLPVRACAFTGPMWGIFFTPVMRPISWVTAYWGSRFGLGNRNPPTTSLVSYVAQTPFEGNVLTRDPDMLQMMKDQLVARPELALAAPTTIWLREALSECRFLSEQPSPDMPCLTFLGKKEKIIDRKAVRQRMQNWPRGELVEIPDGEHEVLMEPPEVRGPVFDRLDELFTEAAEAEARVTV
ncbi:alpha/beta hydrolase [Lutimaribacter marinistellae]|uniref:Alpha/beta hydrolase n=1 Tax=Lutimaribacter marinistellae TaxID=1820329 RepID=A0ABV7TJT7_9RHOB